MLRGCVVSSCTSLVWVDQRWRPWYRSCCIRFSPCQSHQLRWLGYWSQRLSMHRLASAANSGGSGIGFSNHYRLASATNSGEAGTGFSHHQASFQPAVINGVYVIELTNSCNQSILLKISNFVILIFPPLNFNSIWFVVLFQIMTHIHPTHS